MRRTSLAALVLSTAALGGCGADEAASGPDPAGVLPADVAAAIEVTVGKDTEQRKDAFALVNRVVPGDQDLEQALIAEIDEEIAGDGATYAKDIEPWLGDKLVLAIKGIDAEGELEGAIAVAVDDQDKARAFLAKGQAGSEKSYNDVAYRLDEDGNAQGLLEDFFVAAGDEATFKQAVDAAKGSSLADAGAYKDALDRVADDALVRGWVDGGRLVALAKSSGALPEEALEQLETLPGVGAGGDAAAAFALVADEKQVTIEAAGDPEAARKAAGDRPDAPATGGLPKDAWLAFSVAGMAQGFTEGFQEGIGDDLPPALRKALGGLADPKVLGSLDALQGYVSGTGLLGLGLGLRLSSSSETAGPEIVGSIGSLVREVAGGQVQAQVARDGEAVVLTVSVPGFPGALEVRGDETGVQARFGQPGAGKLSESERFKSAREALDLDADPSFFLDVKPLAALVSTFAGADPGVASAKRALDQLDLIALGSKIDGDGAWSRLVIKLR